ncbi:glycosyltransferase, group 1 family protein [Anaerococcus hydrogenalis DSM 7454]|uniref:Glycosyltransferase, group 1 family protein n=1 Tax=Anaerococcus hydrogenalis DSM 7454 TaxID=561177 RepID=B6W7G8_9FIRM|nr:glycosyltransferase [Anaerococcus hydrogenalis]EEB36711.1 glycosyltransferase, group 1 family protein [Anaerococcus hydrogenalis DSM 7454]
MKIWVIGRSYPQDSNNMQGSFELEQAKMLAKHGHDVTYISCIFHPFKKVKNWRFANFTDDNVNIITYSQIYTIERMKFHFEPFKRMIWKKLLKYVEEKNGIPDIIHVHYPSNITVADTILSYKEYGVKIICTEHWSQVLTNKIDKYELNQLKKYVKYSDTFLSVSKSLKDSIIKLTKSDNIEILPNMVNKNFQISKEVSDKFIFVAVGALTKNKQFDKIIEAFNQQFSNEKNCKLRIIGDGKELKNLKNLVKKNKIQDKVIFEGRLSREETSKKVSESDVLVSFSKSETFCVPIIEAWACGIPVITSDSISVNDIWDNRLGFKIIGSTVMELSNYMSHIFENYEIFDKKYIRNYAISNYSEDAIYNKLIYYYSR